MKYLDYMNEHNTENLGWCKPYFDDSEEYCIVILEGEPCGVVSPDVEIISGYNGAQAAMEEAIPQIAKAVNPDYDAYSGWSDLHIALEAMHEAGCASCPFKEDCDAMGEEMEETDWRGK